MVSSIFTLAQVFGKPGQDLFHRYVEDLANAQERDDGKRPSSLNQWRRLNPKPIMSIGSKRRRDCKGSQCCPGVSRQTL